MPAADSLRMVCSVSILNAAHLLVRFCSVERKLRLPASHGYRSFLLANYRKTIVMLSILNCQTEHLQVSRDQGVPLEPLAAAPQPSGN